MRNKNNQSEKAIITDHSRNVEINRQLPPTNTKTDMPKVKPAKNESGSGNNSISR